MVQPMATAVEYPPNKKTKLNTYLTATITGLAVTEKKDMSQYHTPKAKLLPVYEYTTDHQTKSWNEMIDIFNKFVEREGHGNVDLDYPTSSDAESDEKQDEKGIAEGDNMDANDTAIAANEEKATKKDVTKENVTNNNGTDNDRDLMLRSWVREVQFIIRAEGLIPDEKFPQRNVTGATKHSENISNKSSQSKQSPEKQDKRQQLKQRCDSENVNEERLTQLKNMKHFPLERGGGDPNGNTTRSAFEKWIDDLQHYRAKSNGDCNVVSRELSLLFLVPS